VDTIETMLSLLLDGGVETLDISPDMQKTAIERYEEVGTFLADQTGGQSRIYPQGSFRLGTVVRPAAGAGEYDIDLVYCLPIAKESTTQEDLKERVGDLLGEYLGWKQECGDTDGPKTCGPSRRCWTLHYPDLGFHLDVLPSLPDTEYPPTGILLTDVNLRLWQHSNPIGYANWFRGRSEMQRRLLELAAKRHINVADVPEWEVRTTLQRAVQVMKWHAMMRFTKTPELRPPSILITTLAAHAYNGEQDLFTATRDVLHRMDEFIEHRNGTWWVPNPAHEQENFVDKWNEYPERRQAFRDWRRAIDVVLDDAVRLENKGLKVIAGRLSEDFGTDPVNRALERYGDRMREQRETKALRMGPTGLLTTVPTAGPLVRRHDFHGHHPAARR
jgi:hypothetical protein